MKKFQFRLEPLLTLKKQKEDEEFRKLSLILGKINRLQEEIDSLSKEISFAGEEFGRKIEKKSAYREYLEYSDVSRYLNLKIQSLNKEIEENKPEMDLARIRLNEASKEKKTLEILKENDKNLYKKKLKRKERKELEEIILSKLNLEPESFAITQNYQYDTDFSIPRYQDMEMEQYTDIHKFKDEVSKEEKPMSEIEKLQKYYNEYIKG